MRLPLEENETLRECPFDGAVPELHIDTGVFVTAFWVKCHTCGVSPRAVTNRQDAIAAWNKRAA